MNGEKLYQYILDKFSCSGTEMRLIGAIIKFVDAQMLDEYDACMELEELLDPIGITRDEIRNVAFSGGSS